MSIELIQPALTMRVETLDDTEYLFIEAGGFAPRKGNTWTTSSFILQRP